VPGASSYTVNLLAGPAGTQSGNTYTVTGLNPGDQVSIEVVANGTGACGNSSAQQTCTAENCPVVNIAIAPVADICRTAASAPFNLSANVTGASGGTLTWSGNGITNAATGTFDPSQAVIGANVVTAQYQIGNCLTTATIPINVYLTPTASFTTVSPICLSSTSQVVFTGNAGPGAIFNWDFGGGTAMPGTGQGPHQVSWATPGTKTITLTVFSADGCSSQTISANVVVEAPLATPAISCTTTTSSITFNWTPVNGATGYNITVQGQQMTVTNTSYQITGLFPGDTESITVEAFGNSICGTSSASQSCQAQDCPIVSIVIDPVADICRTASSPAVPLTATITNNSGSGLLTWSGPGLSGNGVFNPNQANAGVNTITLLYEEGSCIYSQSIDIQVFETPVSGFAMPASACIGEAVTVAYNGPMTPGLSFDWDFGSGTATQAGSPGSYEVAWQTAGQQTVTLEVTNADGCVSSLTTHSILVEMPVQAPTITCNTTTNSIVFSWANVPGATSYDVALVNGLPGVQGANNYTISNIPAGAGESATIELTVAGSGVCPPAVVEATCVSLPCPTVDVDVQAVPDICLLPNSPNVQLVASVTGGNGGSGQWSGQGISNAAMGIFNPNTAGLGQHIVTYTYVEQGCIYAATTTVNIYQTPTANFSAGAQICIEDAATVTFTGTANAGANFTWDFGSGTATPGTGAGPHQVTWPTGGTHAISLTVNEGACTSQVFTQSIQVDEALAVPTIFCNSTTSSVLFFWPSIPGATAYDVVVLEGTGGVATSDTSFIFENMDPEVQVAIQVTPVGNTSCPVPTAQQSCQTQPCPDVFIDIIPVAPMCSTNATPVTLLANVSGGAPGAVATWSGPGIVGSVFDPAVAGLGIHTATFTYTLANCAFSSQTDIVIAPPPTADAGLDGVLTCWESDASFRLGGQNSAVGPNIIYTWSWDSGIFPADPFILHPEVTEPGVYTLLVIDPDLGCFSTDDVVVLSEKGEPTFEFELDPVSCLGKNDAGLTISAVGGGMEPYYFSLNGQPFIEVTEYQFLSPGEYELTVIDAAGCEGSQNFRIDEGVALTADLTANLVGKNFIYAGEPLQLVTVSSLQENQLDSIAWNHPELLDCVDCLDPVATPWETTTFSVTLYRGSCEASDDLTVYVEEGAAVYVPNAFSPNGDNINDVFTLYPGPQVLNIKSFLVFDRWGETVYRYESAAPGEPAMGWDGTHRGRLMNPAVFTWFAEIELVNGAVKILQGDVNLVR
jgi:gliding motility-associated-like protein